MRTLASVSTQLHAVCGFVEYTDGTRERFNLDGDDVYRRTWDDANRLMRSYVACLVNAGHVVRDSHGIIEVAMNDGSREVVAIHSTQATA